MPGRFAFPGVNTGTVVLGAGARFVPCVPSEPLPIWFAGSSNGRLPTGCVGELGTVELGNVLTGMASGTGKGTRNAKTGFDPAAGAFFAEFFAAGVLAVAFPVFAVEFEGDAGAGAV